ncbi:OPT oligopeptide transporter protein-domain-containing protein [Pseudomassariella vexata]|uniref:OPT oligopeptide transporter protein-domain-containing protein n=1 Tax=Pseudomassariella vexata TaxID=1141098 RepID=A0A1Y2DXR2_9PEZI|nr:OPT oligopeptide transporter protein-domain-containing protein [Pseudomassariella vexata]ORY63916.1 OPT oligopeptide transporter protein-domain-containing protein [Pseudomassariella vexata]
MADHEINNAASTTGVEKKTSSDRDSSQNNDVELPLDAHVGADLNVTEDDLLEAKELAGRLTLEEIRPLLEKVLIIHEHDPNFPWSIIQRIKAFLGNDAVFDNPEKHAVLIEEMKLEAALITVNSPYSEVRAVVDNHDDVNTPCGTIRAWIIGAFFATVLAFINQLFSIRQPAITVQANVAQLLAYPIGKFCEKTLPDIGFTLGGIRHSLNPGKFSKKEHMLITIMANVSWNYPYTNNIIWSQYLPTFYNQSYAGQFAYQILIALATNFIGYGMAGIIRRFLVYPSYCVWPASLVTIALNSAFHNEKNTDVASPFGKVFTMTRIRFFVLSFAAMFIYFWFPNFIFTALSAFSWMSWIAPNNLNLNTITGFNNGLGFNPWPTFDWNILLFDGTDPLMVPFFSTFNKFMGAFLSGFVVMAIWYKNAYSTAYLPINSNRIFDNTGSLYNVSKAINSKGLFDASSYEAYSPPFLSAGNLVIYLFFFGIYSATVSYAYIYHRHEIAMGFRNLFNSFRKNKDASEGQYSDVHNRLMAKYKEVPEWWYTIVLVVAIAFGCAGIAGWETYTSPGVVFYGLALCALFVIPIGIIKAMTGIEVTLNVLAEFIGGSWVQGNALGMNFFKSFGYVCCAHAIWFSNDLKLAHYVKIPPRQTFTAQMVGTFISTFVCVGVLNFQMNQIPGVCTVDAPNRFTCPGINTFFTASVLWGTVGPVKVFGKGGLYTPLLVGFPLGFIVPIIFYYVQKKYQKPWLRQVHPVAIFYGAITWAPYNLSYIWPAVPIAWYSWVHLKSKYLGFWSKYNFVLSASFSSAIAIAAIIIFFSLQWTGVELSWWGNDVVSQGCEGTACTLMTLNEGEYFGPRLGTFH